MIEARDITYTYPGNKEPTLRSLNFRIPTGSIFGFLGPSGAGKSTAQKLTTKLLKNYSGNLLVNGKELKSWNADYYNLIGVGFELPNHYLKLSALENLELFSSFYDKPTRNPMELLKMVGLEKEAKKRVEFYSKGMKMRLNFVRALLHDPDILFLDEPTAGLDPVNARNLKDIIKELKKNGKTIFLTTHNMHDADELCDQVAFLSHGRISAVDNPSKLKYEHSEHGLVIEHWDNEEITSSRFSLKGLYQNKEFIAVMRNDKIKSMNTSEATLEEVFIKLTGTELQ